ncbi:uncharacterized protein ARMOST_10579 [Armillaria ostoyae]|uniref:Uncharacterized protein n=1 Tax=Armillaria ostoyae TaxID=47428 RepID=A0A284RER2_ARMOS|nr:uncharacterized protein ARMOST_10579 [Armillaria ostoyae]
MSTTTAIKLVSTTKLEDDGSNWVVFKEKTTVKFLDKVEHKGKFYQSTDTVFSHPLSDDDLEKLEDKLEEYEQKEAKMRCIIYESISNSTFNEIKGEATAALVWKKLIAVMTGKGDLVREHLLTQLSNMSCPDEGNMREHLDNQYIQQIHWKTPHTVVADDNDDSNVALMCMSDYKAKGDAHVARGEEVTAIADCGASKTYSPKHWRFKNYTNIDPKPIKAANGEVFYAVGKGDLQMPLPMGEDQKPTITRFQNAYHAPKMAYTLISLSHVSHAGFPIHIEPSDHTMYIHTPQPDAKVIAKIPETGGLYIISTPGTRQTTGAKPDVTMVAGKLKVNITELHNICAHRSHATLRCMYIDGHIEEIELDLDSKLEFCETCMKAKAKRKLFPKQGQYKYVENTGNKVVGDLMGPMSVISLGGARYACTYHDLHTHESKSEYLSKKSGTFGSYKHYEIWIKVQHGVKHLKAKGTEWHLTVHDSPQSNGIAECSNGYLMDTTRAFLISSGLPKYLWAEAHQHAEWVYNCTPTKAIPSGKTPFEMATGRKPNISGLRPWGCHCWVRVKAPEKLGEHAVEACFVGIDTEAKGWRIYWPGKQRVSIEHDVYFNKEDLTPEPFVVKGEDEDIDSPQAPKPSMTPQLTENQPDKPQNPTETHPECPECPLTDIESDPTPQPSRPKRSAAPKLGQLAQPDLRKCPTTAGIAVTVPKDESDDDDDEEPLGLSLVDYAMIADIEPVTMKEALSGPDEGEWHESMLGEIRQCEKKKAWKVMKREDVPMNANIVDMRFIYRVKWNETGEPEKAKLCFIAKGFTQVQGVDYFDTYALVVHLPTLHILLSMAASHDAVIDQADIKNAYLHANIAEEIYIKFLNRYEEFFEIPEHLKGQDVCAKLLKCLYGTKQAGQGWYQTLKSTMISLGFTVSNVDEAVFYQIKSATKYTIVAVAMDDFTIIADCQEEPIHWLLGMHITRDWEKHTISIGQPAYIDQIAKQFGIEDMAPFVTPMEANLDLNLESPSVSMEPVTPCEKALYHELLGSLMYVTVGSRPEISYSVSALSQYVEEPCSMHLKAGFRVLCYLKGTCDQRLIIGGPDINPKGYHNAAYANQPRQKSISRFMLFMGQGAVMWTSRKQPIVTVSTSELEYVGLTPASKNMIWLYKILSELSTFIVNPSIYPTEPTILYSDSQNALSIAKDSVFHKRMKHIGVHYHFIQQTIEQGHIKLQYCPTDDMIADVLTKLLAHPKFKKFMKVLGIV